MISRAKGKLAGQSTAQILSNQQRQRKRHKELDDLQ